MENYIADWLNLLFRWLHFITGAAWIGTSFYFNWLNHSLRPPENPKRQEEGISGELFAVHGGHFYQVSKYGGAPAQLPETLHWFKWEAYFTWITGVCLLSVVYYWNAKVYLIDPSVADLSPAQAVLSGIGCLVGGWIIYDLLCKSPLVKRASLFALLGFALLTGAAYGLSQLFGPRAAYIHIGAMIGTMMAANVFFVIIPNQRKMVDAMVAGEVPDISLGAQGALRSMHNNYFTLPVLFIMISNHFPMTYGHSAQWAVLAALSLIGAGARHYFNLTHQGHHKVWILPIAALSMIALAFIIRPTPAPSVTLAGVNAESLTYKDIHPIIVQRCQPCHASNPDFMGFVAPPQGIVYETAEQVKAVVHKIKVQVVDTPMMPPGNLTKITQREREMIGAWIDQGAPID